MKYDSNSHFIFVTCQLGAEKALKKELLRTHPDFSFAYSRPGFLTFKRSVAPVPFNFVLNSVFARTYGISVGAATPAELPEVVQKFLVTNEVLLAGHRKKLHIWEREQFASGEEPKGFVYGSWLGDTESRLRESLTVFGASLEAKSRGESEGADFVVDVVALEEGKFWVGAHLHSSAHSPWPGGRTPVVMPLDSPSRAYIKLEESLQWSNAPLWPDDVAVEIGSAPGGASLALLNRGLKVIGVDPAEMAPRVLVHGNFLHFRKVVAEVMREDFPPSVEWFLLDMNVEPRVSLYAVDRLVSRMKDSLLGVILTVKLNKWEMADQIPDMLAHVRAMGMVKLRAAQLANHRQEIMIYGLTRMGLARKTADRESKRSKKYE